MPLLEDPASFTTLPRAFYLGDERLFEAELDRVWYRQWLYLGHESELPEPGDYLARDLAGESVLLVRGHDGGLAAMLNVCRHRGARMVDAPCGRLKRVVCPYHQWTYDLSGELKAAPSMPEGDAVDYTTLGLYSVPLQTWRGFVFGCLGETPPPASLADEIAALAPSLNGTEPERLRPVETRTYDCAGDWKVMLENYLECYHCSASHPEFCMTADLRLRTGEDYVAQAYDEHPYWGMEIALRAGAESATVTGARACRVPLRGADFTGRARTFGDWAAASVLYFYADYAMVHEIQPVAPGRSRMRLTWLVDERATPDDYDVDALAHVWDMTTRQDVALIERTQLGLRSRRYRPGPLSVRHEPYIRSSLDRYRDAMEGDETVARLLGAAG